MAPYIEQSDSVILFDGYCNLCSGVVQFVIKRDKKGIFKFASLESEFAKAVLKNKEIQKGLPDSFVLIQKGVIFTMSTAALKVAKQLSGPYPLLYAFIIIPEFIRNFIYRIVAKYRYKWFGKTETCWLPPKSVKEKFIAEKNATYSRQY